ncbi:CHLPS 43 kDa protein homolog_3 [Chlamydia pneumoniae]|uniref:CHLPS 43 kDa protein homolog_3 n=1 Tax=Chlamydia pneumoniae TaxID=83558 RepID=A0A0F7XER0_CHLPN|nr:CHLPS 43 kDa-like protein 3 [Chlamydia pneumoniae CWL029]CRI33458.1 CHLPS 43 kDa protein homolog_3 [Chlamydia pneumoniae]BAA99136.1 CHLPS 43 kDa protein homolog_3 [Chlamydia pneumoniae J138]CRI36322.1 CHLPS 43 kDa protein homolog_3 [Chlamydia pneumoniae]CRI37448.1 CHLPS 43 kDa protein homolog_3 [Chlamydia pneumoniae]
MNLSNRSDILSGIFSNPHPVSYFSSTHAKQLSDFSKKHPILTKIVTIIVKIFKLLIGLIIPPLGIYWLCQLVCSLALFPRSSMLYSVLKTCFKKYRLEQEIQDYFVKNLDPSFKDPAVSESKRITIQQDHLTIDTLAIHFSTARPKRWLLISLGSGDFLEDMIGLKDSLFLSWKELAKLLGANILIYNYPGVKSSTGKLNLENLATAHNLCAKYLQDKIQGPGANEIITYGYSLGGVVQSAALQKNPFTNSETSWVAVKDRAPHSLPAAANSFFGPIGKLIAVLARWKMDAEKNSRELPCPEILVYSADRFRPSEVGDDTALLPEFTLAHAIKRTPFARSKKFIGEVNLLHSSPLKHPTIQKLAEAILESLSRKN